MLAANSLKPGSVWLNPLMKLRKISPMKETEKFKPYSVDTWETSGWTRKQLLFSAVNGDSTHVMTVQGGTFLTKTDNTVKTMTAIDMGEGEKPKYEWIDIPWADRLKPENIKKVVKFRKWTIDLNPVGYRKSEHYGISL